MSMDLSLWGKSGTMYFDPNVPDLSPGAIAQYVAPGWHWGANQPELNVTPPDGWSAEFGNISETSSEGASDVIGITHLLHDRGNGMYDVYYPDGRYWITSSAEGGSGVLQQFTYSMIGSGIGAAAAEVYGVASAGGLASQSVTSTGASTMPTPTPADFGPYPDTAPVDFGPYPDTAPVDFGPYPDYPSPSVFDPQPAQVDFGPYPDSAPVDFGPYPYSPTPVNVAPSGPLTSIVTGAQQLSAAALAVAQTVRVFQGVVKPASQTVVANPINGTVNGRIPAVGVATALPGGGALINNGDGTYTVIGADGSSVVKRYPTAGAAGAAGGALDQKTLLYGALGLVAVFALTRRGANTSHRS